MVKKLTLEKVLNSIEYKMMLELQRVCKEYDMTEDSYFKMTDISGVFWEPFLDRLYKLGVVMKFTKKLKEIKMDWIRPLLYFGQRSDGIVEVDGRHDIVNKTAIAGATIVRMSLSHIIADMEHIDIMNEENFKEKWKDVKNEFKIFFKNLIKFVKEGFRAMHEHVKLVLYPLRMLRKSGYRLFSLEKLEENNTDLTMFKDKKDFKIFNDSIVDFFKWEKWKQSKDVKAETLDEFFKKPTNQRYYEYTFNNTIRPKTAIEDKKDNFSPYNTQTGFNKTESTNASHKSPKNTHAQQHSSKKKSKKDMKEKLEEKMLQEEEKQKRLLILPNIKELNQPEPTKLKHEAYQLAFEEGIHLMIVYLNDKQPKRFPNTIDSHKIFVNLNCIPDGKKIVSTKFYLDQLDKKIEELKVKCYEMKLNGLSRVKLPITENVEIIDILKNVYDLHIIIDNCMGNYLLFDQYVFIYDSIKFITESVLDDQIQKFKNKKFMEERIPKYVLFQSMCKSVDIINKMILHSKEIGEYFNIEDYYQITKYDFDTSDNIVLDAYEINEIIKKFVTPELEEKKKLLYDEIKQFGRFWLMEGFFPKEDKNLWIEAIILLQQINELVREDIRDHYLYPKEELDLLKKEKDENPINRLNSQGSQRSSSGSSNKIKRINSKIKKQISKITNNIKTQKSIKRGTKKRISKKSSISSKDSLEMGFKLPNNLNDLRPPNVWNFPLRTLIDLKKKKTISEGGVFKEEIRDVDPTVNYHDKRVEKFYDLFDKIYENMKIHSKNKGDMWNYIFDKILIALGIHYSFHEEKVEKKEENEDEKEKNQEDEEEKKIDNNNVSFESNNNNNM